MKIIAIAATAAALTLVTGGCKKEEARQDVTASPEVASGAAAGATATATAMAGPDQVFVDTAAASDAFEIQSSKLAASKASSAKVRTFAEHMITAHTDSTAKLKTAATAAMPAITPTPALSTEQRARLDDLEAKSGADFDRAYADMQVKAHEAALGALRAYSANGGVPSLKAFATDLVPVVAAHLNTAKGL